MSSSARLRTHKDYMIGWICTIDVERTAARAALDEVHPRLTKVPGDSNNYIFGRVGDHDIVIASLPSGVAGVGSAAIAASQMFMSFRDLKFCLMVGIGGGIPYLTKNPSTCRDIRLGDVVIGFPHGESNGVVQYDLGKIKKGQRWPERIGTLAKPPRELLNAVGTLQTAYEFKDRDHAEQLKSIFDKHSHLLPRFAYQGSQNDKLFKESCEHDSDFPTCDECDWNQVEDRPTRQDETSVIFYGTIASGNLVVKDPATRSFLRDNNSAMCVEMEAAGLMDNFKCLVIRGISDYADSHKNDTWQACAAIAAAACAKDVLLEIPKEDIQTAGKAAAATFMTDFQSGTLREQKRATELSEAQNRVPKKGSARFGVVSGALLLNISLADLAHLLAEFDRCLIDFVESWFRAYVVRGALRCPVPIRSPEQEARDIKFLCHNHDDTINGLCQFDLCYLESTAFTRYWKIAEAMLEYAQERKEDFRSYNAILNVIAKFLKNLRRKKYGVELRLQKVAERGELTDRILYSIRGRMQSYDALWHTWCKLSPNRPHYTDKWETTHARLVDLIVQAQSR